jgi:hypothetical protein
MTAVASQLVSRETRWQMPPPKPLKPANASRALDWRGGVRK